jgi:hypothetical protein
MKTTKIIIAAISAAIGCSISILTKASLPSKDYVSHYWRTNLSTDTVYHGSIIEASVFCPGDITTCLIACDNSQIKVFGIVPL